MTADLEGFYLKTIYLIPMNHHTHLLFNGYFKISPYFAKRYPTLTKMLELIMPSLINDEAMMDRWITNIGFQDRDAGKEAWKEMLTFGSGPFITPIRPYNELNDDRNQALSTFFDNGCESEFTPSYPDNLAIGSCTLIDLESAIKQSNGKEAGYQIFLAMMKIMHEGGHWARRVKAQLQSRTNTCFEDGAMAEMAVTGGIRFSYRNCRVADILSQGFDYDVARKYYDDSYNRVISSENQKRNIGVFIPKIPFCFGIGVLKQNIPQGQSGDKTLSDNGDKEPVIFTQGSGKTPNKDKTRSFSYDY